MLITWIYTLTSVVIISLISLIGIVTLPLKESQFKKILLFLVSFSAGALLGDSFLHLLPESIKQYGLTLNVPICVLSGILIFFVLEKFIHWRHCHIPTSSHHPHPVGFMNLIGDGFHNCIDGMIVAGSYLISIPLGIGTTFAVVFHEIPHEMGNYGILLHAGFSRKRALLFNLLSASISVIGAVIVLIIGAKSQALSHFLIPFTAGTFIYVSTADIIPELHEENEASKSVIQFLCILLGIGFMALLLLWE